MTFDLSAADPVSPTATLARQQMPTFDATGLDVLASIASGLANEDSSTQDPTPAATSTTPKPVPLNEPGPYNPVAFLPPDVAKQQLELKFVDMAEVTPEDSPTQPTGSRRRIVTLSQWLERFSIMAATIATRFPKKAPELFAYQALIIRAERTFESACWVAYDRQFRRQALSRGDLNWSVPDARLYNISFTGRAKAINRCAECYSEDHLADRCPTLINQSLTALVQAAASPHAYQVNAGPQTFPPHKLNQTLALPGAAQETCRRYNAGTCRSRMCKYVHVCIDCAAWPTPTV